MHDQWTNRLSAYLDDELETEERGALQQHLDTCAECAATLDELRRVVHRARALEDRPPARDLWPDIAARIGISGDDLSRRRARRRVSLTVPQLVAASLLLAVASAGAAFITLRSTSRAGDRSQQVVRAPGSAGPTSTRTVAWTSRVDSSTARAVAGLQRALAEGRRSGRLDSLTVRTLEHSLAVIDTAVDEARRALAADPRSAYLNLHLADTMRRKLEFLREATRIASPRT